MSDMFFKFCVTSSFIYTKKRSFKSERINLSLVAISTCRSPILSIQLHCSFRRLRDLGIARNSFAMTMNIPPSPPLPFLFAIPKILNTVSHAHHVASQPAAHRSGTVLKLLLYRAPPPWPHARPSFQGAPSSPCPLRPRALSIIRRY